MTAARTLCRCTVESEQRLDAASRGSRTRLCRPGRPLARRCPPPLGELLRPSSYELQKLVELLIVPEVRAGFLPQSTAGRRGHGAGRPRFRLEQALERHCLPELACIDPHDLP